MLLYALLRCFELTELANWTSSPLCPQLPALGAAGGSSLQGLSCSEARGVLKVTMRDSQQMLMTAQVTRSPCLKKAKQKKKTGLHLHGEEYIFN